MRIVRVIFALVLLGGVARGQWSTRIVDNSPIYYRATWASLAARGDTIHVFYNDWLAPSSPIRTMVKYARSTDAGATWQFETVDTFAHYAAADVQIAWWRGALALAPDGTPHVAYTVVFSGSSLAQHAYRTPAGVWVRDTIEVQGTSPAIGYDAGIAMDHQGRPHVAYNYYGGDTRYAYWNGSSWVVRDLADGAGYGVALALDGNDNPHIGIGTLDDVRYAFSSDSGNTWTMETIEGAWWQVDIAVDNSNAPHLVYCRLNNDYRHAVRTGPNAWSIGTIEYVGQGNVCRAAVAVDDADVIHAAYYPCLSSTVLKYARSTDGGSSWATESVTAATPGSSCDLPGLSVVPNGKLIAYQPAYEVLGLATELVTGAAEPSTTRDKASVLARVQSIFDQEIRLELTQPLERELSASLYNSSGAMVLQRTYPAGIGSAALTDGDVGRLAPGAYFLTLTSGGRRQQVKVLRVR
jgi:hypothetical protein